MTMRQKSGLRAAIAGGAVLLTGAGVGAPAPAAAEVFERVASFAVTRNLPEGVDAASETSPEIISVSDDGMTLVYSDSPLGALGFVDIADAANPQPGGVVKIDGEPTTVSVKGGVAYVAVNTSESYANPSGAVVAFDIATRAELARCDLGGQPDSLAVAPDGSFLAVAVENERDEDLNDGEIPQAPAGFVAMVGLVDGALDCASMIKAEVAGLAAVAGDDPEPEFVDINAAGDVAVTMQENNHIVILARDGSVRSHFSAGAVDLAMVDVAEEGALTFDGEQAQVLREPDAVKWLDDNRLVVANEGDYKGGSRGFTIFSKSGETLFESGLALEYQAAMAGHYPERRSGNKGVEPEGLAVGQYGDERLIFVLLERASLVGVYRDTGDAPEFLQLLPSGVGPEGAVAIPSRGLFVTANEADLVEDGAARAHVMIYSRSAAAPTYPMIRSGMDATGRPIGWGALSGLAADPATPGKLYAVNDGFFAMQPSIFEIDATQVPAAITRRIPITRAGAAAQLLDLEGVAADGEGGFWLASEGRSDRLVPHALYHVNGDGEIKTQVAFPPELLAVEKRFGAEGLTLIGDVLWVAIQREWADDPKGQVKLVAYDTAAKQWLGGVAYPLEPTESGWMGLSEIAVHGDHVYIVERDNLIGDAAVVKRLYRVAVSALQPAAFGAATPLVAKELVRDLLPDLRATGGYVVEKVEGFAVDAAGEGFVVTDNDGVDDSSGETLFFSIGKL